MAKKKPATEKQTSNGHWQSKIVGHDRVAPDQIVANPLNYRKHPQEQRDALKDAIEEVGFIRSVTVNKRTGNLIDGHERVWQALTSEQPFIDVEYVDLSEDEERKALATMDPISEMATTDKEILDQLLREVNTGSEHLQQLLSDMASDAGILDGLTAGEVVEDEVPPPPADPITKPGDLWILGEHRLLCGDSTSAKDVERLMEGKKASLVFTDPPYGMSFQSNMRTASPKFDVLENDDTILTEWIKPAIDHSAGWVFVWTTWKVLEQWLPVVKPFGPMTNMVVWSKGGGGLGDLTHTFSTDYEVALVFSRGAELCGKRIGSVWAFHKDAAATYLHPTQKPVALAAEAIEKTTHQSAIVLDVFLGSGTTLIAAEQLGRKCYALEISPQYCDVAVQRWEKLTGKEATREQHG